MKYRILYTPTRVFEGRVQKKYLNLVWITIHRSFFLYGSEFRMRQIIDQWKKALNGKKKMVTYEVDLKALDNVEYP